jgi:sulfide:quinone oxidoreductase
VSAPLNLLERRGVEFVKAEVTAIDPANRVVKTTAGNMNYDYLIISLGAEAHPELVRGRACTTSLGVGGCIRLRDAIKGFKKGRIVVAVHSTPYRCPPAPWETALLLDYHFSGKGIRGDITITMAHPFKRPFENFGPLAAKLMEGMMQERKIGWIGLGKNSAVDYIDQDKKVSYFIIINWVVLRCHNA